MTDPNEATVEAVAKAVHELVCYENVANGECDHGFTPWDDIMARAALAAIPEPATVGGVTREQMYSLAESYAYDRWPDQTVQDDPELITEAGMSTITEWLTAAGILTPATTEKES